MREKLLLPTQHSSLITHHFSSYYGQRALDASVLEIFDGAGVVSLDLSSQLFDGRKLPFVTQAMQEAYAQDISVEVS